MKIASVFGALLASVILTGAISAQPLNGPVIISEIMYNTAGPEPLQEWLEIYNTGITPLDISGWYLQDEDGQTAALPLGTGINPGEALIICPDLVTVADFQAAWGTGFQVFPVAGWTSGGGINGLANSPSATNEILTLRNVGGMIEDEVNYDDGAGWPNDPGGPSIFALSTGLTAVLNDIGANWAQAQAGTNGGYNSTITAIYTGSDTGSPGFVDTTAIPFDASITCASGGSITVGIQGGTPGNIYYIAMAFVNAFQAPTGWFFGINITPQELTAQLSFGPPFVGTLGATGSATTVFPVPGLVCPLGLTVDTVAFEWTPAGAFVQTSSAMTVGF